MAIRKLFKNTYRISEWGPFGPVKMYLLIGSEKALLIDCGYGKIDLKKIIGKLTEKPVTLLLTHGHIDHARGCFAFDDVYLDQDDFDVYRKHSDIEFQKDYFKKTVERGNIKKLDFDAFDLGDRKVSIIKTPGHTQGSICVIDPYSHIAFLGDTVNPYDVWLGLDESTSVEEYQKSLKKLLYEINKYRIDHLYSGHNTLPMKQKKIIDFICLCNKIINNEVRGRKTDKGICKGYKVNYKSAALIYKERT